MPSLVSQGLITDTYDDVLFVDNLVWIDHNIFVSSVALVTWQWGKVTVFMTNAVGKTSTHQQK